MNLIHEGTLIPDSEGNISDEFHYLESEIFSIKIAPEITQVIFPDGLIFKGTVDFQTEFYDWVNFKPADYRWVQNEFTTLVTISLPSQMCIFRLEMGENCWWAGFQTHNSRYLKRFQFDS